MQAFDTGSKVCNNDAVMEFSGSWPTGVAAVWRVIWLETAEMIGIRITTIIRITPGRAGAVHPEGMRMDMRMTGTQTMSMMADMRMIGTQMIDMTTGMQTMDMKIGMRMIGMTADTRMMGMATDMMTGTRMMGTMTGTRTTATTTPTMRTQMDTADAA